MKIGLLSDTHGYLDPELFRYFSTCDEIWHAGDFGKKEVSDALASFRPLRGVYGNIDGKEIRAIHPLHQKFNCEEVRVWITHIGGYPGNYDRSVLEAVRAEPPDLFISGHSHILKVMHDKALKLLHLNPGAAGKTGWHKIRTALRFEINGKKIENMEVIELGKR